MTITPTITSLLQCAYDFQSLYREYRLSKYYTHDYIAHLLSYSEEADASIASSISSDLEGDKSD